MKRNSRVLVVSSVALVVFGVVGAACGSEPPDQAVAGTDSVESQPDPKVSSRLETAEDTVDEDPPSFASIEDDEQVAVVDEQDAMAGEQAAEILKDGGSLEHPQSFLDVQFFVDERFGPDQIMVELYALVSVERREDSEIEGSCYVIVGSLTPVALERPVSNGFAMPPVGLIAGGQHVDSGYGDCNLEQAKATGYRWILDAEVTVGTSIAFYDEIFLPASGAQEIDAIVVGSPSAPEAFFFSPDVVAAYPPPGQGTVGPTAFLNGVDTFVGQTFSWSRDDSAWEGTLEALVRADPNKYVSEDGTCLYLVGNLVATSIGQGTLATGLDTPEFSLIVDGRLITESILACEGGAIEAAGYGWVLDAEIPVGVDYPFFAEFLIPDDMIGDIQAIVIGPVTYDDATLYLPLPPVDTAPPAN